MTVESNHYAIAIANEQQNQNQPQLVREIFPALW